MYNVCTNTHRPTALVRVWIRNTQTGAPLTSRWVNTDTLEVPTTCVCYLHQNGAQPCA